MLRLRPSSIVLTHDEVNTALERSCPISSPGSTSSQPWDHIITVRRQRRKGKQRALDISNQEILVDFQELSINQPSNNGGLNNNNNNTTDTSSLTTNTAAEPEILRSTDLRSLNELVRSSSTPPPEEHLSIVDENPRPEPPPPAIDGAFSFDDFDTNNWVIYTDPGALDSTDDDVNDADVSSAASSYHHHRTAIDVSGNLPLRSLIPQHIPAEVDGAAEAEADIIDEDAYTTAVSLDRRHRDPAFPLPNSARLHSRLSDTLQRPPRIDVLNESLHESGSWFARSVGAMVQEDLEVSLRRWSITMAIPDGDVGELSDDSLSGVQLTPDTIAELEERKQRRQTEAARRIIR